MSSAFSASKCPQCGANLAVDQSSSSVTCAYCGASLVRTGSAQAGAADAWGMRLRLVTVIDQAGLGMEAFRLLVPADWKAEGGIQWTMNRPAMPASVSFRTFNPVGLESFEILPTVMCYWTNEMTIRMTFPVGSLYFGSEVRPPEPVLKVLQEIVVPRYRGKIPGLQIVRADPFPDLAKLKQAAAAAMGQAVPNSTAEGGRLRTRYRLGQEEIEEDIAGVVEVTKMMLPTMFGISENYYWTADYLLAFRARVGEVDRHGDQLQAMLRSFRIHPQWYARYVSLIQYLTQNQIQQINNIGQLSRYISQTQNQISDMIMSSYQRQQETRDRLSASFSQAIRGTDEYQDPFRGESVELPGGYDQVWATSLGDYLLVNDANFNPNVGSNLNWERLAKH